MIVQALSLGFSAGLYCMVKCVPTLAPLLLISPQKGLRTGMGMVGVFLAGRLVTYSMLGALAGLAGSYGAELPYMNAALALSQVVLGALLMVQAFYSCARKHCPGKRTLFGTRRTVFFAGILSSVTLCPPILLAFSVAMEHGGAWQGLLFFVLFFLATSIYVLPVSLAALKLNNRLMSTVSRMACAVTGLYFAYQGVSIFLSEHYVVY